ncbi:MAG: DHA2 family efflux MFS transporter permease subunit [Firmicutes bacterium]|nr:DHA2 family efflux MFS transporter permease subunit [Bacillota bacterium]
MGRLGVWKDTLSKSKRYRWLVFATVVTGTFMVNVDSSIMNVALPALERDFHVGPATLQWVISAYLLMITGILPIVGSLSDRLDRTRVFVTGVAIFTIGSMLCAFSGSISELIVYRVLQSVGGSIIMGNVMSIVSYVFPAGERGRPLGLVGSVVAAGTIVGPSLGGILIAAYGWRSIFWINVPIGVLSILAAILMLQPILTAQVKRSFDRAGAALFFVGIISLMVLISEGQTWGWTSLPSIGALFLSVVTLTWFVRHELRSRDPVIDLSLFTSVPFTIGNVAGYISYVILMIPGFLLPLYMHDVLHIPTAHIGLLLTPQAISMILFSPVGGWLADRFGTKWPSTAGMLLGTLGLGLMALLTTTSSYLDIVIALSVFGMGMGLFTSPNNVSILESAPIEKSGLTGSLMATIRNFGRVSGVALTVLFLQWSGDSLVTAPGFARASAFTFTIAVGLGLLGTLFTMSRLWIRIRRPQETSS